MPLSTFHLTSGDSVGANLVRAGLAAAADVFVWRDLLYEGVRRPGWPDASSIAARVDCLYQATGGGISRESLHASVSGQYERLQRAGAYERVILWFDACLFDQSMLVHVLACLQHLRLCSPQLKLELLEVAAFPGIEPFHGLGQLTSAQLASCYELRRPVTIEQLAFAWRADRALAERDLAAWREIAALPAAPLAHVPAAFARLLQEEPDPITGLGRLEELILQAVRAGARTPMAIFQAVSAADNAPQYWGDTTLWAKINGLANRQPPLVTISGPAQRLPQWESQYDLAQFSIAPILPSGDLAR